MSRSLSASFLDRAMAAMTSAVEVYNKPNFIYREETFSLLALNAWELVLKAKILRDGGNKPRAIQEYERRATKKGVRSKKLYVKRNRSGNAQTISLGACIAKLDDQTSSRLQPEVKANLYALTEIRDNAAHYILASPILARQTLEVGTATVKNFVLLAKAWFNADFSEQFSIFLPLAFVMGTSEIDSVVVGADEARLLRFIQELASLPSSQDSDFAVAVRVDVRLERSSLAAASTIQVSDDAEAVTITLTEEDIRNRWPWTYEELTGRLAQRYSDFKQNADYHRIRIGLYADERFVKERYLDPVRGTGTKKLFFNPNILQEFDKHYTKR